MLILAIIASLFSAAFNALASVLERISTKVPNRHSLISRKQAISSALSKLFVLGFVFQIVAFLSQAVALSQSSLVVVEPLLTTDLIFLLLILKFKFHVTIGATEWLAVGLMIVGMGGLFFAAHPRVGQLRYDFRIWIIVSAVMVGVIAACLLIVRTSDSVRIKAAFGAVAAALSFTLIAAFTKLTLNQLSSIGLLSTLTHWPIYALLAAGAVSIYLLQVAYGSGPLAIAQPILEVAEPTFSVLIGINIFGDSIRTTPISLAIEIACVLIVSTGIIILSTSSRVRRARMHPKINTTVSTPGRNIS